MKQKIILLLVVLALIGGAAMLLDHLHASRKLGTPGIKATALPDTIKMAFDLPEHVLDYASTNVPQADIVVETLPKDTSFAQRRYTALDGFWVNANIILMGTDRTSIHKPEYCLPGQGWQLGEKTVINIPIEGAAKYELPVARWVIRNSFKDQDGKTIEVSGIYVFWFVADGEETPDYRTRIWWLTRDLLTTGVLQRWAYVSYFAICNPGQEDTTFKRMEKLIAASVPEFQFPPVSHETAAR